MSCPSKWKLAEVTLIFKNDARSDVNNYRPISVISVVAKIFEKVISAQYSNNNIDNGLLNEVIFMDLKKAF